MSIFTRISKFTFNITDLTIFALRTLNGAKKYSLQLGSPGGKQTNSSAWQTHAQVKIMWKTMLIYKFNTFNNKNRINIKWKSKKLKIFLFM